MYIVERAVRPPCEAAANEGSRAPAVGASNAILATASKESVSRASFRAPGAAASQDSSFSRVFRGQSSAPPHGAPPRSASPAGAPPAGSFIVNGIRPRF